MIDLKKSLEKLDERYLGLISFIVLFIPLIAGRISLFGFESYRFIYSNQKTPFHFVVETLTFLPIELALSLLVLFFGVGSIVLFYKILLKLKYTKVEAALICLITIFTPAFIYTFKVITFHAMAVFITLLSIYLTISSKRTRYVGMLVGLSLILFSIFNFIFILSIYIYFALKNKNQIVLNSALLLFLLLTFILSLINPIKQGILINSISDLGGFIGFGLFNIILFAFGMAVMWKKKFLIFFPITILLLALLFLLGPYVNSYLVFAFSYFVAFGLIAIMKLRWSMEFVKNITLLLIICGLLFSYVSFSGRLIDMPPSADSVEALHYLSTLEPGVVLSSPNNNEIILFYGDKLPLVYSSIPLDDIFQSRNFFRTRDFLYSHNVSYIYIDKLMRSGNPWSRERQGLLFLLRNNETFEKEYDNYPYEIWRVKSSEALNNSVG